VSIGEKGLEAPRRLQLISYRPAGGKVSPLRYGLEPAAFFDYASRISSVPTAPLCRSTPFFDNPSRKGRHVQRDLEAT
jgi:hypothetical protein